MNTFLKSILKIPRAFKSKIHIKVFLTKGLKFRAHVKEPGKPAYEVTIGGKEWQNGKGRKHEKLILTKAVRIDSIVTNNLVTDFKLISEAE